MRSKQLLALMMAVAVTAQPQMVAASDSANQASEVQVQSSAEETETADQTVSEKADQTETPDETEEKSGDIGCIIRSRADKKCGR